MKSYTRRIVYLVIVMLFTMTSIRPVPVLAAEGRTARIYDYSNEVTVTRGKADLKAFKGMRLKEGDTIKTGKNSNAYIEIDSDKVVKLDASTIITISNMSGSDTNGSINISLTSGKIYNDIKKKLTKNSTYKVRTPNAVMGVRGTTFVVDIKTLEDNSSKTVLAVFDGTVAFSPSEEDSNVYVEMNQTANTSDLTEEEKPVVTELASKNIGTFELNEIVKDTHLQQNLNKLLIKENKTLDETLKQAQEREKDVKEQEKELEKQKKQKNQDKQENQIKQENQENQNKQENQDKKQNESGKTSNSNSSTNGSANANENEGSPNASGSGNSDENADTRPSTNGVDNAEKSDNVNSGSNGPNK